MRIFNLIFFIFLLSCGTLTKKEYVCGDRPCIDKKEFEEYFAENLIVEITSKKRKKNNNPDLVKINTASDNLNNHDDKSLKQQEKIKKITARDQLKAEKTRLKEERKIKKEKEKLLAKKRKEDIKKAKIDKKQKKIIEKQMTETNKQTITTVDKKINNKSVLMKEIQSDTFDKKNIKSICDGVKDCDIDKIAEILIKKGKDKPFPNISSN